MRFSLTEEWDELLTLELPFVTEDGGDVGILDFFIVVADGKVEFDLEGGDLPEMDEGLGGGMGRGGLPTRFETGSAVLLLVLGEFGDVYAVLLPLDVAATLDTLPMLTDFFSVLPLSVSRWIEFLGLLLGVPFVDPLGLAAGLSLKQDTFFLGFSGTPFVALLVTMTFTFADEVGIGRLLFDPFFC